MAEVSKCFYDIIYELNNANFIKFARFLGCPENDINDAFCGDDRNLTEKKYTILENWKSYLGRQYAFQRTHVLFVRAVFNPRD